MKIRSLSLHSLSIPFKVSFRHSSAERTATQSVLAIAETESGELGLGEGCPREYVTGEDVDSCMRLFAAWETELIGEINTLADLERWNRERENQIDENPAAWCAIELALLDVLAKESSQSVESAMGLPELTGPFQYSAVLGDSSVETLEAQVHQYVGLGFTDFKVKVSGDPAIDNRKFAIVTGAAPEARIRLDANNLWRDADAALSYLESIECELFAMEEPLPAMEFDGLLQIARARSLPIILDESFLNRSHFTHISKEPEAFIINLRISKMGGLVRSLQIASEAAEKSIPLIVGAQVGETSILTRAAMTVGNAAGDHVLAREGAFGTLLLERDIVEKPLTFGSMGRLDVSQLLDRNVHGWQMNYDLQNIRSAGSEDLHSLQLPPDSGRL